VTGFRSLRRIGGQFSLLSHIQIIRRCTHLRFSTTLVKRATRRIMDMRAAGALQEIQTVWIGSRRKTGNPAAIYEAPTVAHER
jgi:hypothetical protein